jgi:hypothetical protein
MEKYYAKLGEDRGIDSILTLCSDEVSIDDEEWIQINFSSQEFEEMLDNIEAFQIIILDENLEPAIIDIVKPVDTIDVMEI